MLIKIKQLKWHCDCARGYENDRYQIRYASNGVCTLYFITEEYLEVTE
jgi:hypothetical protein